MLFFHFFMAWWSMRWARFRGLRILTTPFEQEQRFSICGPCQHNSGGVCDVCKCLIQAKIMLTTEECPKKLWRRVRIPQVTVKQW
jgi:hypothetical protein